MPASTTLTVRLSPETKAKLDRLAELTQRSKSFLAAQALEAYATQELEICEAVLEGIEDAEAGNLVPHDEAMAEIYAAIDSASKKAS